MGGSDESKRFNPRPQRGGRRETAAMPPASSCFNPRPQRGGRHPDLIASAYGQVFQSAPSARGATASALPRRPPSIVSIRALSAGGDLSLRPHEQRHVVSIRALSAGGDLDWMTARREFLQFQSAPSARGATPCPRAVTPATRRLSRESNGGLCLRRRFREVTAAGESRPNRHWRARSGTRPRAWPEPRSASVTDGAACRDLVREIENCRVVPPRLHGNVFWGPTWHART